MQSALESALAELVLGTNVDLADEASVRAWLARHHVAAEDRESILTSDLRRLGVYRSLVRENLRLAIELSMPRVVARLGALFDEYFDRFLLERGPRTHYLRDVTNELLDYCEPLWPADARVPRFMMELARHEVLQIEIGAMRAVPAPRDPGDLALEHAVLFIDACRLVRYQHAVHRLSDDVADRREPAPTPAALFVYRSPEHEVRYLELTPLAAAVLERLLAGRTLGDAVSGAASDLGAKLEARVLQGAAQLLSDLAERGALLGRAEGGTQNAERIVGPAY